jgi:hypothetical protein
MMPVTVTSPSRLEVADRLADLWRILRQQRLTGVVLDGEALLRRWLAAAVRRHQAPADAEECHRHAGQRQPHRRIVEQVIRLARHLLAHLGDQHVRRGADLGDRAADQRAERERHQVARHRPVAPLCRLDRHRHEHTECADVLHERREEAHRGGQRADLQRGGVEHAQQPAHRVVDHAGYRDRAADHEQAGDDDDHRTGEALERLLRGHDAGEGSGRQCEGGDQVVAQPVGNERDQHAGDDRQGLDLRQGQWVGS